MKGFGGPTQAPAWVTHGLVPLINLGLALLIAGIIIALIGENPLEALRPPRPRRRGLPGGDRLHALLHHQLRLHRARRRHRLPLRPLQHWRRGPGLSGRPRRGAYRALSGPLAGARGDSARDRLRHGLRRLLGLHPRLAAGEARQPHRHHDDHVQLPGRGADDLPAGRDLHQAGAAGGREPQIRDRRLAPLRPRYLRGLRWEYRPLVSQPEHRRRRGLPRALLVLRLAHALGLRDPCRRAQRVGGGLRRYFAGAARSCWRWRFPAGSRAWWA